MVRRCFRLVLPVLLVGPALPALAQGSPRSIGECERLKNDLAYNQCLAMFGPPAKSVAGGDGSGGAAPMAQDYAPNAAAVAGIPSPEEPELAEPTRRSRRGRHARRGERQSASFAVSTAGDDSAAESGSSRRGYRRHRRRR